MENWLEVPGYSGVYEVSDQGRVRSNRSGEPVILRLSPSSDGHLRVRLGAGRENRHSVHRLVLFTFRGEAPPGTEGCHNDGDPSNNRLENLRWDTRSNNAKDALRHGKSNVLRQVGVGHPLARFSDDDVRAIRAEPEFRGAGVMLARCFGVTPSAICAVRRGRNWRAVQC